MSNVFYPLSLIQKLTSSRFSRVVADEFEDGATSTRALWLPQYFKRRFDVQHSPLTLKEWRYLRSFHSQRSGTADSFWFRDNVNRGGNALVRFASELPNSFSGQARMASFSLNEVAPIRALPEFDEVIAAAGGTPLLWWDPNRDTFYTHADETINFWSIWDEMMNYPADWQDNHPLNLNGTVDQYQSWRFTGEEWAKTAVNIAEFNNSQPALSIFLIGQHGTMVTSTKYVVFKVGNFALELESNVYKSTISGVAGATTFNNSPGATYRSVALTCPASSNTVNTYVNAALIGTTSAIARNYTAGPASFGANTDGSRLLNSADAVDVCFTSHVLLFAHRMTLAQVKALHNLLGYQYGLAVVP